VRGKRRCWASGVGRRGTWRSLVSLSASRRHHCSLDLWTPDCIVSSPTTVLQSMTDCAAVVIRARRLICTLQTLMPDTQGADMRRASWPKGERAGARHRRELVLAQLISICSKLEGRRVRVSVAPSSVPRCMHSDEGGVGGRGWGWPRKNRRHEAAPAVSCRRRAGHDLRRTTPLPERLAPAYSYLLH
jgi:hypothetical protein